MRVRNFMGESSWVALRQAPDAPSGGDGGGGQGGAAPASGDQGAGAVAPAGGEPAPAAPAGGTDGAPPAPAGGAPAAPAAPAAAAPAAGDGEDWREKELSRRGRRLQEERTARETLERENQQLRELADRLANGGGAAPTGDGTGAPASGAPKTFTQDDVRREAERLLNEERTRAAVAQHNTTANNTYNAGVTTYGKDAFEKALSQIGRIQDVTLEDQRLIFATEKPEKVLYELGQNPAEYLRILELPPERRTVEFVKLSLKPDPAAAAKPSAAPAPVDHIGGRGGDHDNRYDDNANSADWHAQEAKREQEHWKRKQEGRI